MKLGSRLLLIIAFAAFAVACGGGTGAEPSPAVSPTGEEFPEGIPPSDNEYTQTAELLLLQAAQAEEEDPAAAEERYAEALETAMEGIEHDPENAESYFQGGRAYLGLRDYEGADSLFTTAEELYPAFFVEIEPLRETFWVEAFNEAIELLNAGNLEEAIPLLEQAGAIYDRRPEGLLNLGSAYTQVGDLESAIEAYREAIEVIQTADPELFDEETIEVWRENEDAAILNLAQLLSHTERHEEAVEAYNEYLEQNPDDTAARSNLAIALMNMGDEDAAVEIYEELLARPDISGEEYSVIGVGLFQIGAYDQAAEAFERAVEVHPNSRDDVYNWAQTLFLSEDWDEFLPVAQRLVEVDPFNQDAYRLLAHGLVQTGDEQEAVRQMEHMEAMPFEIADMSLQLFADEGAQLSGQVYNIQLEPGTPIEVRFTFFASGGEELGTTDVQVQAPPVDESVGFTAEIGHGDVVGYRYEVLSH